MAKKPGLTFTMQELALISLFRRLSLAARRGLLEALTQYESPDLQASQRETFRVLKTNPQAIERHLR